METVIQEIANQLGMAVDQASQFIAEQLPNYAALKVTGIMVSLVIIVALSVICAVISLRAFSITKKQIQHDKENNSRMYGPSYGEYPSFWVFSIVGVLTILLLISLSIYAFVGIPKIIGWLNYPEAMLIDMALKAVS